VWADPNFVNGAAHDYRLAVGSPAIDHGIPLGSITPFVATAPDIGRWEMR
jgi:hypothetical protein